MDRATAIQSVLQQLHLLRGSGPTTFDYLRWRDGAEEMLEEMLGPDAPALRAFRDAVGPRTPQDAEGLQVETAHGMLPRLARAETVLRSLLGERG